MIVLGIGDGGRQHLARVDRHALRREGQDVHRVACLLAADQARYKIELLGRTADLGRDRKGLVIRDAAGSCLLRHQRLPFLSAAWPGKRSEEHTSELQSLMRISYAVFCLKKKKNKDVNR